MRYFYTSEKQLNIARAQTKNKAPAVECLGPDGRWVFNRSTSERHFFGELGAEIDERTAREFAKGRFPDVEVIFED